MKSITVHLLDEELVHEIKKRANERNMSLNRTIKQLLRQALGLGNHNKPAVDFSDLCGVWSAAELREFEDNTADFGRINKED
jgi:plasmid stability protein